MLLGLTGERGARDAEAWNMNQELQYLLVVVGLFIIPRVLQRHRIPSAITCVVIGAILGMGFHLFHGDAAIPLLATLGIVSLFLFAGLEVDFEELGHGLSVTMGHLAVQLFLMGISTWVFSLTFGLDWRPAVLMSLAVLTPSAGFILDSLSGFGLTDSQRFWVKTKAISSELLALGTLFAVSQSSSVGGLALSTVALVAMVALLPLIFQSFAKRVLPFAPKSEFAFLLILALLCAYLTRQLGVYYLVGAFVVGVTAVRLRKRIPELASERMIAGIDLFASFFIPFYFFKAGLHFHPGLFQWDAILIGVSLVVVTIPIRVAVVAMYRRFAIGEPAREAVPVALSLVPTLVFTVVLAGILRDRYGLTDQLFGALIVFALINTSIPGIVLRPPRVRKKAASQKRAPTQARAATAPPVPASQPPAAAARTSQQLPAVAAPAPAPTPSALAEASSSGAPPAVAAAVAAVPVAALAAAPPTQAGPAPASGTAAEAPPTADTGAPLDPTA